MSPQGEFRASFKGKSLKAVMLVFVWARRWVDREVAWRQGHREDGRWLAGKANFT